MPYLRPSLLVFLLAASAGWGAAPRTEEGTFALVRGGDTIATERFTRTPARLVAELDGAPGPRVAFTAVLTADATIERMEVRVFAANAAADAPPLQQAAATFRGDSLWIETPEGDSVATERRGVPAGTLPYLNPSPSLMEQILRRARALGGDTVRVPTLIMGSGGTILPVEVAWLGADSVVMRLGPTEVRARADREGALLGAVVPSQGVRIDRAP